MVLVFSYIGHISQKVTVGTQSEINLTLEEDVQQLNEIVIIGYGSVKKSDLTGSVSSVEVGGIEKVNSQSIENILQGRAAGVQVTSADGTPGSGMDIRVRGSGSVNASNEPLYVIDGFAVENDAYDLSEGGIASSSTSNPMAQINPSDIESIEILKDASATAIYGSRGANGVIIVETKSGKQGSSKVNFDASFGVSEVPQERYLGLMNSQEFADFNYNMAVAQGSVDNMNKWDPSKNWADTTNTDWQDEMFKKGLIQNYNVGISGGNRTTTFAGNIGYFDQKGIVKNDEFTRFTAKLRIKHNINKKLRADLNINANNVRKRGVSSGGSDTPKSSGIIRQIMRYSPLKGTNYEEDLEDLDEYENDNNELTNPKNSVNNVTNSTVINTFRFNAGLEYKIIEGLKFTTRAGAMLSFANKDNFYPYTTGRGKQTNGQANISSDRRRTLISENFLNYDKSFGKHTIGAMAGFNMEQRWSKSESIENTNFGNSALGADGIQFGTAPGIPNSNTRASSLVSVIGRANYSYNNKYLLTTTIRRDESSKFADGNKVGYFPSVAAAYKIAEEDWFPDLGVISTLKLRASWGEAGNYRIPDYLAFREYDEANYVLNGAVTSGYAWTEKGNDNLTWETSVQSDIGLDLGLFDERIVITADAYYKETYDLLFRLPTPSVSGFTFYWDNIGTVINKGVELGINTVNLTGKFVWETSFNIAWNQNRLDNINGDIESFIPTQGRGSSIAEVGESLGQWYGYETAGLMQADDFDDEGNLIDLAIEENNPLPEPGDQAYVDQITVDTNNDGIPDSPDGIINADDRVVIGNSMPIHFGGLNNYFEYKGFSLNVFLQWSYGNDIWNANRGNMEDNSRPDGVFNRFTTLNDMWRAETLDEFGEVVDPGNFDSDIPGATYLLQKNVDRYIEDGSFLRLKGVTVGYKFPAKLLSKVNISQLSVYLTGSNLYTWTNYSGYDPEVNTPGTSSFVSGMDWGSYPRTRTYSFGISATF